MSRTLWRALGLVAALMLLVACTSAPECPEPPPAPAIQRLPDYTIVEKQVVPLGRGVLLRVTFSLGGKDRTHDIAYKTGYPCGADVLPLGSVLPSICR